MRGLWIAALLASVSPAALALEIPKPCDPIKDMHVLCVNYDPGQRYRIKATKGMGLDLRLRPEEFIARAIDGVEGYFQHETPQEANEQGLTHDLTLLPDKVGRTTLVILTKTADGKPSRRYLFDVTVEDPPADGEDAPCDGSKTPCVAYALDFTYHPPAKPKPEPKPEKATAQKPDEPNKAATPKGKTKSAAPIVAVGTGEIQIAANGPISLGGPVLAQSGPASDLCYGKNMAYVAKGDKSIQPKDGGVCDDGRETFFEFNPNTPLPTVFIYDGKKEEIAQTTPRSNHTIIVHTVAHEFHLYHGQKVLYIVNQHQDLIGHDTGTGTDSPFIERQILHSDLPK